MEYKQTLFPDIEYKILPSNLQHGMFIWIEHGTRPGDFLWALINNDFIEICGKADTHNQRRLMDLANFMYNQAPSLCWNLKINIKAWPEYVKNLKKETLKNEDHESTQSTGTPV